MKFTTFCKYNCKVQIFPLFLSYYLVKLPLKIKIEFLVLLMTWSQTSFSSMFTCCLINLLINPLSIFRIWYVNFRPLRFPISKAHAFPSKLFTIMLSSHSVRITPILIWFAWSVIVSILAFSVSFNNSYTKPDGPTVLLLFFLQIAFLTTSLYINLRYTTTSICFRQAISAPRKLCVQKLLIVTYSSYILIFMADW